MTQQEIELVEEGPTLGPVEGIKKAVVSALKAGLALDINEKDPLRKIVNNVTMEYPMIKDAWPAMWVGFSVRKIQATGINEDTIYTPNENKEQDNFYRLWSFEGTATVTILALSSLERDRLSDSFIRMFAFRELHRSRGIFWDHLDDQEYVYIYANKGELKPGGQSEGPGIAPPWDSTQLGYTDNYSFDIGGQFASNTYTGKLVKLREIRIVDEMKLTPKPGSWV